MNTTLSFFAKVKIIRNKKKLSQHEIATSLNITQSAYSKLESGCTEPTLKQAYQIADKIETSIFYLLPQTNILHLHTGDLNNSNVNDSIQNMNIHLSIEKLEKLNIQISSYITNLKFENQYKKNELIFLK